MGVPYTYINVDNKKYVNCSIYRFKMRKGEIATHVLN